MFHRFWLAYSFQDKVTMLSWSIFVLFRCNLIPRFSLLPVKRPWLGLAMCLPESGRLQTKDFLEGQISVRFFSAGHRQVSGKCSHETVYLTDTREKRSAHAFKIIRDTKTN